MHTYATHITEVVFQCDSYLSLILVFSFHLPYSFLSLYFFLVVGVYLGNLQRNLRHGLASDRCWTIILLVWLTNILTIALLGMQGKLCLL